MTQQAEAILHSMAREALKPDVEEYRHGSCPVTSGDRKKPDVMA